jgi:hypothetical protein
MDNFLLCSSLFNIKNPILKAEYASIIMQNNKTGKKKK